MGGWVEGEPLLGRWRDWGGGQVLTVYSNLVSFQATMAHRKCITDKWYQLSQAGSACVLRECWYLPLPDCLSPLWGPNMTTLLLQETVPIYSCYLKLILISKILKYKNTWKQLCLSGKKSCQMFCCSYWYYSSKQHPKCIFLGSMLVISILD